MGRCTMNQLYWLIIYYYYVSSDGLAWVFSACLVLTGPLFPQHQLYLTSASLDYKVQAFFYTTWILTLELVAVSFPFQSTGATLQPFRSLLLTSNQVNVSKDACLVGFSSVYPYFLLCSHLFSYSWFRCVNEFIFIRWQALTAVGCACVTVATQTGW